MRRREFLKSVTAGSACLCTGHPLWAQHAGMGAFRIVALTDRLPQDLRQVAAWAKKNGLSGLEIGRIGGKPVHELANPRDTTELKAALAAANLTVASLATPVFLCPLEDKEAYRGQLQQLDRCLELARALGTPLLVVRAFLRKGGLEESWNKLAGYFREPVRRARDMGITLGVVNDPETFIGTGRELARFIETIGSPQLKAVWDPCAAIYDIDRPEIPYPDGYQRLKRYVALVRVRDVDRQQHSGKLQECVLGDGLVGWAQQIRALAADRFQGPLSISTGWQPGVRPSGAVYTGDNSPEGAQKATQICVAGLRKLEAPEPPPQRPIATADFALGIQRHFAGEEFCTDDDRILTWEATRVRGYLPLLPNGYQSVRLRPSDTFSKDCTAGTTVADQLAKFANRMSRAVREVRPDMGWDYTVYQMNWAPPPSVELDPSLTIYLHPIHRCFNHAVDDPTCAINATLRYEKPNLRIPYGIRPIVEAYAKKYGGRRLGITDYWLDASFYGRPPFAPWKTRLPHYGATMQQDMRFYHGLGIRSTATYVLAVEHQYLERYTSPLLFQYGALLWNPDADLAAELRLFCANWFGNESLASLFEWREHADPKDLTPDECRQLAQRYSEKIEVVKSALTSASNDAHLSRLNRLMGEYEHCLSVMKMFEKMVPLPLRTNAGTQVR